MSCFGRANNLGEQSGGRNERQYILTGLLSDRATLIRGVHAAGGWTQLAIRARDNLDFNFAYGQNDPRNGDLRDGVARPVSLLKNQAASANLIWHMRQNFVVSGEVRRIRSSYATQTTRNNHYNLAFGYVF